MIKGIKIRLYPNQEQEIQLRQMFGNDRFVWNQLLWMLEERYHNQKEEIAAYKESKKENPKLKRAPWLFQPSVYDLDALLPRLKEEYDFLQLSDSSSLQMVSKRLKKAYEDFFNPQHPAKKPKKKKLRWEQSYTGKLSRISVVKKYYMKLPKLGIVKSSKTGAIEGKIKRYTLGIDSSGRYWLSLQVEVPDKQPLPKTNRVVGIDVGLSDFAIFSHGDKIAPFDSHASESQARIWQRKYSRRIHQAKVQVAMDKHKGVLVPRELTDFSNWQKARIQKARYQSKVANQRSDFLHKVTTQLVRDYDIIVIEDLKVKNLMKNHSVAWAIANASWATFRHMLEYKCEWYGKELIVVPPHYTSRICHKCKVDSGPKPLNIREWTCTSCGTHHDRDVNAARNILYKGLERTDRLDLYTF